jgi:leucine dehydrogenase
MVAVHSTVRGPSLGGCRMWRYADTEAGVRDALRLSEAMTYKAAVAGLPMGGGKGVIALPPGGLPTRVRRADVLRDFADTVAMLDGRYITAEDVGTSSRDMGVIASVTPHVSGTTVPRGGSGDPSPATAIGVYAAIEAGVERRFGSASLRGRSVAVLGVGSVGARLAGHLVRAGARVVCADIVPERRAVAEGLGARWTTPGRALAAAVDVLAPCALGGILSAESVPRLRAAVIAGAANNQLADPPVADLLAARGILWVPDFVANAGGIVNIAEEIGGRTYDRRRAHHAVRRIGDTVRRVLDDAESAGTTPLAAAMTLARERLASA